MVIRPIHLWVLLGVVSVSAAAALIYLVFFTNTLRATAKLSISAEPPRSIEVLIDGKSHGMIDHRQTPQNGMFTVEIPTGSHTVELLMQSAGYRVTSHPQSITLEKDQHEFLVLPLETIYTERSQTLLRVAEQFRSDPQRQHDFIANTDGTVNDKRTGLQWQACSLGQQWHAGRCEGEATAMTWQQARQKTSSVAEYNDWRLPTIFELQTLVICSSRQDDGTNGAHYLRSCSKNYSDEATQNNYWKYQSPTIISEAFPQTVSSSYWSASSHFQHVGYVFFNHGVSSSRLPFETGYVRLVRDNHL